MPLHTILYVKHSPSLISITLALMAKCSSFEASTKYMHLLLVTTRTWIVLRQERTQSVVDVVRSGGYRQSKADTSERVDFVPDLISSSMMNVS